MIGSIIVVILGLLVILLLLMAVFSVGNSILSVVPKMIDSFKEIKEKLK